MSGIRDLLADLYGLNRPGIGNVSCQKLTSKRMVSKLAPYLGVHINYSIVTLMAGHCVILAPVLMNTERQLSLQALQIRQRDPTLEFDWLDGILPELLPKPGRTDGPHLYWLLYSTSVWILAL